jgi:abortive infection Abi-like protein
VAASLDLLPRAIRAEVIDAASAYTLAEITKLFTSEGFSLPSGFEPTQGRMRRSMAEAFDSTIDFRSPEDVEAYLRVVERLLDELATTASRTDHFWAPDRITKIRRELGRAEVTIESDGRLRLTKRLILSQSLAAAPTESGIRLAITRLERSEAEPEEKVGAAKELVEATMKHALAELAEAYDSNADIPALAKVLHRRLRLDPRGIAPTARGAETMVRLLAGFSQIPQSLAELRNEGYGTGHGQVTRISGIKPRHADLAARSAIAYAAFILDTLADPEAPWR